MEVRPIGVLIMEDDMGLDHKLLAVPVSDPRTRNTKNLRHLPSHYLAEIDYFFNIYKDLEGKKSDTYGWENDQAARRVVMDCIERDQQFKDGKVNRWGQAI